MPHLIAAALGMQQRWSGAELVRAIGAQLRDLRTVLKWLAAHDGIDGKRLAASDEVNNAYLGIA